MPPEKRADYWLEEIRSDLASPGGAAFVASADGRTAGLAVVADLVWETRVLGRRMAGIRSFAASGEASERLAVLEQLLDAVILHAEEQGVECLVHRSHADDAPAIHALERRGFLLMDTLLDYVFDFQADEAPAAPPLPPDTRVRAATPKDMDGLVEVARRAFASHSGRFHSDERISHACAVRVYEEWIRSCVEGWADWVLAAERDGVDHRLLGLEEAFRDRAPSRNCARALQRRSGCAGAGRPRALPRPDQRRDEAPRRTRAAHRGPDARRQHSGAARLRRARLARRRRPPRLPPLVEPLNRPGSPYAIPFNRPCLAGREEEYMRRAVASGHLSGDGEFTRACHSILEKSLGVSAALLTTSCTHALEMAAILLDIAPGDEVIVPSFTFVSTANAFVLRGARPVFADIRPDTLNLDESAAGGLVTPRTRAIVAVHYAGVGCEMDAIAGDRGAARRGCRRGQRARPVRAVQREVPGHVRLPGDAELSRDEELHLRRGRRSPDQRSSSRRAGGGHPGEGDLPDPFLPRRGGQVHVGGPRLELSSLGSARRVPPRAARGAGARFRRGAGELWERYAEHFRDWARRPRRPAARSCPPTASSPIHMFYLILPSPAARQDADRASQRAGHPGGLPLPAAPSFGDGQKLRRQRRATAR